MNDTQEQSVTGTSSTMGVHACPPHKKKKKKQAATKAKMTSKN